MAQINQATTVPQLLQIIGGEHDTRTMPNGIHYAVCGRIAVIDGAFDETNGDIVVDVPNFSTRYILNFSTEDGYSSSSLVESGITKIPVPEIIKGKKFMVYGFAILPR